MLSLLIKKLIIWKYHVQPHKKFGMVFVKYLFSVVILPPDHKTSLRNLPSRHIFSYTHKQVKNSQNAVNR